MKYLTMVIVAVSTIFFTQVVDSKAALLSNEIKIEVGGVLHGPKFGDGWSVEQKKVWDKTQEWWQLRMGSEWDKLKNLYHKNAIIYPFFKKVPIDFHGLVESLKDMVVEFKYCTVHEIRIIENIAIVMFNYESVAPSVPKRAIFIWMEQSDDWKLISQMSKEE